MRAPEEACYRDGGRPADLWRVSGEVAAERKALAGAHARESEKVWKVEEVMDDIEGSDPTTWERLRAALAVTTGEGEHVAREVFTADGIPCVRCSCSTAKSPTSFRWLTEHVPNGGLAELQAVIKRQGEGAKA